MTFTFQSADIVTSTFLQGQWVVTQIKYGMAHVSRVGTDATARVPLDSLTLKRRLP